MGNNQRMKRRKSANDYVRLSILRLKDMNEIITTKKLIEETGMNDRFLSRILKELEEANPPIIRITKDLSDGRCNIITFTRVGDYETKMLDMFAEITPDRDEIIDGILRLYDLLKGKIKSNGNKK